MASLNIAYFVSPHGFGHAARACAVIEALARLGPDFRFHVFSTVPRWFFSESLTVDFNYRSVESDVGLVQVSPLEEDLEATVERLNGWLWRDPAAIDGLVAEISYQGCNLVIADISPLGLMVAKKAGLPSVLVENFTWDWIYANYSAAPDRLLEFGERMASVFSGVDLRIQTRPACSMVSGALSVPPVARAPRISRNVLRRKLAIPEDEPMVLFSMGGVRWDYDGLTVPSTGNRMWIVVPGGAEELLRRGRTILLPFHSSFYHPDLVAASDLVVGKLGYSTVAEIHATGSALAYLVRPRFPESAILEKFVNENLIATQIEEEAFRNGRWAGSVERLLEAQRRPVAGVNGADSAAEAIVERFTTVP